MDARTSVDAPASAIPHIIADVLVAGGGLAGIMAALSAARHGSRVVLAEAGPFVGGIAANGPLEALMTFHDENGMVVRGIPDEFIGRMRRDGACPGHVPDTVGYCASITPYDVEELKYTAATMLDEDGVTVYLNTMITGAAVVNNAIVSAAANNVSGVLEIRAASFVDCTGDAVLASRAGATVWRGRDSDGKTQPVTLLVRVGGVDRDELRRYIRANPHDFIFAPEAGLDNRYLHLWGFGDVLREGYKRGTLSLRRNEIHAMFTPVDGEMILNYSRVAADPLDAAALSKAQLTALRQVHELVAWFRERVPGFDRSRIVQTGRIGVRESGRIRGRSVLTRDDVVNPKPFPDTAARGAFPVDIHQPDGDSMDCTRITRAYNIPSGCLRSADLSNLYMAGRCISASHEAIASARIAATCMATGEAAGKMAAGAAGATP